LSDLTTLRIGIDGFNLGLEKGTGVAAYARTLSQALKLSGHQVDVLYGLDIATRMASSLGEVGFFDRLASAQQTKKPPFLSKRWIQDRQADIMTPRPVEIPITGRIDSRAFAERLPEFDRILNIDSVFRRAARHFRRTGRLTSLRMPNPPAIMHWTYPLPVRIEGSANVYTLHDIVPLRLPHTTLDNKPYYHRLLKTVGEQADGLCTVSEASKADILAFFPEMATKLHNTYQACDTERAVYHRPAAECIAEIEGDFGLAPKDYFLFYGSLEPKKNIGRLIEAFLASGSRRRLVLVGAMAWKSEKELRYVERGVSSGRLMMIDYLPERTLFALLRQARALLFPSLSEGFGLPVIEAMNCGTPVLISGEGALPEISGDAALQTEAYDIDAITHAIRRLDQDDALCESLAAAGTRQAQKFDMSSYQARLNRMYGAVLSSVSNRKI